MSSMPFVLLPRLPHASGAVGLAILLAACGGDKGPGSNGAVGQDSAASTCGSSTYEVHGTVTVSEEDAGDGTCTVWAVPCTTVPFTDHCASIGYYEQVGTCGEPFNTCQGVSAEGLAAVALAVVRTGATPEGGHGSSLTELYEMSGGAFLDLGGGHWVASPIFVAFDDTSNIEAHFELSRHPLWTRARCSFSDTDREQENDVHWYLYGIGREFSSPTTVDSYLWALDLPGVGDILVNGTEIAGFEDDTTGVSVTGTVSEEEISGRISSGMAGEYDFTCVEAPEPP